ncbi:MAG: enoyl-CoA hydratase/isomerase family protein [Flammeovirgaceae bacterium]|nr:enoyl-CoA hydratase/isomerase family protein [Flammeovirgaceae bacterium]
MVEYEVKGRIAYITLNRPERRNALSFELIKELKDKFADAEKDQAVKIIVLKANGKAFCSGADLESLQQLQKNTEEENLADSRHLKELFQQIYTLQKVVIAQVEGHALAGGCGLATVCDFVLAVPEAKFGYTEVKIGFIPALVMVFLIRKIGEMNARYLLLSGELVSGEDALKYGMANRIVEKDEIQKSVDEFAQQLITNNSSQSLATTKKMIAEVSSMKLDEALEYAAKMNAKARSSEDCKKGIEAFLNKKPITW